MVGDIDEEDPMASSRVELDEEGNLKLSRPKLSGKIKLTYDEDKETERALEVDADAYMSELRGQVCAVLTVFEGRRLKSFRLERNSHLLNSGIVLQY